MLSIPYCDMQTCLFSAPVETLVARCEGGTAPKDFSSKSLIIPEKPGLPEGWESVSSRTSTISLRWGKYRKKYSFHSGNFEQLCLRGRCTSTIHFSELLFRLSSYVEAVHHLIESFAGIT